MRGSTVCPHCSTRFKITKTQLEAHHGMVRCGHCMQSFDTHTTFAPDQPDPQLELPILDRPVTARIYKAAVPQPMTLAEQVTVEQNDDGNAFQLKRYTWLWATASLFLLLLLLAQSAYFFRVDLAARLPILKPALVASCKILRCSVPLPQHTDLIGIESSELEADPINENQITLNALLRNRAPYAQAFPNLELTLNDGQDQALSRHMFFPTDYLPQTESKVAGLLANHELSIKLRLNITDLKPLGYRLVLLYQNN